MKYLIRGAVLRLFNGQEFPFVFEHAFVVKSLDELKGEFVEEALGGPSELVGCSYNEIDEGRVVDSNYIHVYLYPKEERDPSRCKRDDLRRKRK
jgi:hypothetical protein